MMINFVLQALGSSDTETLGNLIKFVLFTASGWAVKKTVDFIVFEWEDGRAPISPRTKRWLSYLVSIVLPTALYLFYTFVLNAEPYLFATNIMVVLYAFGVGQFVHGITELPTGKDIELEKMAKYEVPPPSPPEMRRK